MPQFITILHCGEPAEGGFWTTCLEVRGANGQGETQDKRLRDLFSAIQLTSDLHKEEALR